MEDLLAYLKVLANPSDRESMTRVLTTPRRGIGAKSLTRLFEIARERGWSARQALRGVADLGELSKKATLGLRDVANLLDRVERGATGSVAELLRDTIACLHYEEHLKQAYPEDHQERVENVRELVGGAEEYDVRAGDSASLPDFLHEVGLVSDADQYDPDMPRVALMTLHSAKGLEFREVYVAGIEDGLLPHARSSESASAREEEPASAAHASPGARPAAPARSSWNCRRRCSTWTAGRSTWRPTPSTSRSAEAGGGGRRSRTAGAGRGPVRRAAGPGGVAAAARRRRSGPVPARRIRGPTRAWTPSPSTTAWTRTRTRCCGRGPASVTPRSATASCGA